jgi:DNA excision repair protein ERCC-5
MYHFLTNSFERPSSKGKAPAGPTLLEDNTVYLEDIDPSMSKTPVKKSQNQQEASSPSKRSRFYDHDPYRLPELDYEQVIANATRSSLPDPRLATEEELRAYIEELCPEDFDVTSPEFRELPTEIQYEIVGDLRLKSRQTSFKRLQNMLKNAPTALDFSRQQIVNLKQRNALTQQLLMTTDSIGNANISIPVRIASERNKEYVLIKNEGQEGGWILGMGDGVTQANPVDISADDVEDDSDMEMEEVAMYVPYPYIHP